MNIPGKEELQIRVDQFLGIEFPGFPSLSGAVLGNVWNIPGAVSVAGTAC